MAVKPIPGSTPGPTVKAYRKGDAPPAPMLPAAPSQVNPGQPNDPNDPDKGAWIDVSNDSTNVARFRWIAAKQVLYIVYQAKMGRPETMYSYAGVSLALYEAFKLAPSFGHFRHVHLNNGIKVY